MIERKFVSQKLKEFQIQEYISDNLKRVGHSHTKLQKTPLGDKVIIYASRPGLVVGRRGENIRRLTEELKTKFGLDNPQIEINEVPNPSIDAHIISEKIANTLERFGTSNFKGVGHKTMEEVMSSGGALGVEIVISGKIPSSRAKRWRFYRGYIKKCGDLAVSGVKVAYAQANLKTGIVGVQVRIMPPDIKLPDNIQLEKEEVIEVTSVDIKEKTEEQTKEKKPQKKEKKALIKPKQKSNPKKETKKEVVKEEKSESVKVE